MRSDWRCGLGGIVEVGIESLLDEVENGAKFETEEQ